MKKINVGDILYSTFGYEACLATFWKVLKRTEKSVTVARLMDCNHTGSWDAGTCAPIANSKLGETKRLKVRTWYDNSCEYLDTGYGLTHDWDGTPIATYNHH